MPKLAVLGQPISHSRSPAMHTAALEAMGLAVEWSYGAIEISPEGFEARVRTMAGEGFAGANVTVPHKVAALAIGTEATPAAAQIGAANTLSFRGDGIAADNTDAAGVIESLPESPDGKRALVLGAGGSARAAIWALREAGAEVSVWNRTGEKALRLAHELAATAISIGDSEFLPVQDFDLVLNATTVGLAAANAPGFGLGAGPDRGAPDLKALRVPADALNENQVVVDLVYGTAQTQLAAAAQAAGARVVDGLDVLVHQGAASLRIWTGMEPPTEIMRRAARER